MNTATKFQGYVVRHQGRGPVADHVFAREPQQEHLDAAKVVHDHVMGTEGWVKPHPVVLDFTGLPEEVLALLAQHLDPVPPPPPSASHAGAPGEIELVRVRAVMTMTHPDGSPVTA